jgi:hypothetical protein
MKYTNSKSNVESYTNAIKKLIGSFKIARRILLVILLATTMFRHQVERSAPIPLP